MYFTIVRFKNTTVFTINYYSILQMLTKGLVCPGLNVCVVRGVLCVCLSVCVCVFISVCVCVCVCMCVCVCVIL